MVIGFHWVIYTEIAFRLRFNHDFNIHSEINASFMANLKAFKGMGNTSNDVQKRLYILNDDQYEKRLVDSERSEKTAKQEI